MVKIISSLLLGILTPFLLNFPVHTYPTPILKMHRVTENPSEFSPGNHLRKVKKRVGCLPLNGTPHHETYGGLG